MTSSDAEKIHVAVREHYARAAKEAGSCCDTTGSATDLIGRTLYSDEDAEALPETGALGIARLRQPDDARRSASG